MNLRFYGFGGPRTIQCYNPAAQTLGHILGPHAEAVALVRCNGQALVAWETYVPQAADELEIWLRPGWATPIIAGMALTWGALATQVALAAVMFGISYGLSLLLANRPDPTREQNASQTFGIAGLSNTTALGTPKFVVYGTRRVFGHLISSYVSLEGPPPKEAGGYRPYVPPPVIYEPPPTGEGGGFRQATPRAAELPGGGFYGTGMSFSATYYMGEGEVQSLKKIEINEIPIANYAHTHFEVRRGTAEQTSTQGSATQVYQDGRELSRGLPVIYQTKGDQINDVRLLFAVPFLQYIRGRDQDVRVEGGSITIRVERKTVAARTWSRINVTPSTGADKGNGVIRANTQGSFFWSLRLTMPAKARWQIRLTAIEVINENNASASLFNVVETDSRPGAPLTYPNSAVLTIYGIASKQITSLEGMQVSAMMEGRKVWVWNGVVDRKQFSRNRVWIVRDILTDPRVGMGHRIPASLWDQQAALDAATYYAGEIGKEPRDYCDIVINQRRPAWDWVKDLLTEGNAALYPSRGLLKYVIDRPRSPVTAYLGPGNLVAESQTSTIGATGPPPNTVRGEFADAAQNYRLALIEVVASDIGSELLNEQTTSLKTVTRESQAIRVLAYGLKKTRLALRRYSWKSPLAALPSEPFDVVRLGYHTPARRHGYSGYLQAGSTALLLVLDQAVPLVAGTTYEVLVNIQRLNLPLVRTFIATATRAQVTIAIAPALGAVPEPGDLYGIGVLGAAMVTVLLDHVAMDETATTLTLAGAEYRPDIYDTAGTGVLPQTQTAFHDFPALYAEDITTRYHASYRSTPVSGQREATDPWPGAQLYRSQDPVDEDYLLDTQGAPLPCMGTALTALPAAPAQTTDFVSTVDVTVSGGILTSITPGELQMGFNALLLGTELLNFRIAEDLGGDTYRLRQLRRGRRGTEVQVGTHQSGERCLLIGTGVFTRDMLAQERSRTRNWKSPTIGEDVTQVAPAPYAAPSLNLVPWTVGSARGVQLSDGTWRLSWRGRARFWGEWVDGEEATPDADFVHYLLTIYQDATRAQVVHQVALGQGLAYQTPATFMYSAAQQQSDFGSVQTTLYWDCVQVGLDGTSAPLLLVSQAGEGT